MINNDKSYFVLYASHDSILVIDVNYKEWFAKKMLQSVKYNYHDNMIN